MNTMAQSLNQNDKLNVIRSMEQKPEEMTGTKLLITDDKIEIIGSEEFVSKQIEVFKDVILQKLETARTKPITSFNQPNHKLIKADEINNDDSLHYTEANSLPANFDNVYVITNDQVKIIADVPGEKISQRMINLILIYMWVKLQLGIEEISFKELREMCEKYGEVDKPNFSKIMNSHKKLFLISGENKNQTARLIRPGMKTAEKLLIDLNSQE